MKSKEALRGEIYSFIVAHNTAKSGGGFDKKVFPHSLAFLARLYILVAVYIGKDYLACDKIQDNRISTHQDLQHCIAVLYK